MNNSIYKFSLDVHEAASQVVIELKQSDTAREFQISLTENGRPYVITEGCYAVFTAKKSDGTKLYHECIIDGNVIRYTTQPQTTSAVGEAFCEIQLYGANDALLISPSFIMLVHEKIFKDGDIPDSNNDFSALVNIYERTNALYNDVCQKLESGELRGADGKSAYEIAKDNGFEGTEAEWLESLVGLTEIPDNSISTDKIQNQAVTSDKIADKSILGGKLAENSVTRANIANGTVTTGKIVDKAVTPAKLDREYVTPDYVKEAIENIEIPDTEIKDGSIESRHLVQFAVTEDKIAYSSVSGSHIKKGAVANSALSNNAVTDEKIKDKTISKGKMAFDVATEDFVRNSIRNISGGKPLIGDVVSILDDFEGYEIHQVVKTTDLIPKSWSNVKIWSADDGITATELNPTDFDFSQIAETNYAKTTALPTQIDFSSIAGRNVICSLVFKDEEVKKAIIIQLLQPTGSNPTVDLMLYFGDGTEPLLLSYTSEQGWLNDGKQLTEANKKLLETTFPSLKIVDFASLHKDNPEVAPDGVEISPEILIDIFLKDWMQVYYPMGYYLTDKSADTIPKSWAEVQRVVRSGQASKVFNIGDQLVCTKNGVAHVWDIIGIDHDTLLNPNYKHSITLQLNTAFESAAFDDDSNDYSTSNIRAYLNGDYLTGFDEDFLAVIGGVRKSDLLYNIDEESTEDDIYPGSDIFFLLSSEEVSTKPYEYYSTAEIDPEIRVKTLGTTALCSWRLRSKNLSGESTVATDIIGTTGNISVGSITRSSYCLAPACVVY